jgi:hypothetical protein|tara:strand:- start:2686 stop:2952 length:267 start_codon:yes stop_codon:yes gene_type:complete
LNEAIRPRITEKPTNKLPKTYPVSISQTANKDIADTRAQKSLILSLKTLSWSVFRILSTPGYDAFDLRPSTLNWRRCLADILAKTEEK